jgi:hypothetical protein
MSFSPQTLSRQIAAQFQLKHVRFHQSQVLMLQFFPFIAAAASCTGLTGNTRNSYAAEQILRFDPAAQNQIFQPGRCQRRDHLPYLALSRKIFS